MISHNDFELQSLMIVIENIFMFVGPLSSKKGRHLENDILLGKGIFKSLVYF